MTFVRHAEDAIVYKSFCLEDLLCNFANDEYYVFFVSFQHAQQLFILDVKQWKFLLSFFIEVS